jgi:4-aminobutyrate aminotransferase-like enzyme
VISTTPSHHRHSQVVAAAQAQMAKLVHGQVNIAFQRPMLELCDRLKNKVWCAAPKVPSTQTRLVCVQVKRCTGATLVELSKFQGLFIC